MKFLQVMISSELRTQGLRMLEQLIRKRLIFGGPVFSGPARFLWKNEIVEHDYCWTITFTRDDLRDELIREAETQSAEAICMITFTPFDGSPAMHVLLEQAGERPISTPQLSRELQLSSLAARGRGRQTGRALVQWRTRTPVVVRPEWSPSAPRRQRR